MAEFQVAWPFTLLIVEDLDEFIDIWAGWLSDAAQGAMGHPSRMLSERVGRRSGATDLR